ncbi:bifunctional UDP-N-acetylglucosamine pyrophosphorylase / glucosamine-1-phosphate N-acetyltransferase [Thermotomaculum hydrothermale]|uniref:Bifunctional protein GlmU n=1 Tax=Thermotomaculum hydrothermale TaxID=981385 RepID=A0A7R6PI33_9BACT|nr:bifunctional UDP-N-acetylglucosamine diphosphorylase/glucosamine-1-phosphate N-acetyltransferase GlmU [Thermotomaculum hydrothermale]BBB32994.1 bifunctional UDP-N-acetylglucosamine pyrophosphorylase / glucosamine-1-phosphate N-acetyltransferase [Thermotomaculum hydrothermale]
MTIKWLILAAGEGKRMKSSIPKVFHKVAGIPILFRILRIGESLRIKTGVVLGKNINKAKEFLQNIPVELFEQKERLGTAHAVMCASEFYSNPEGYTLITPGDIPLLEKEDIENFITFTLERDTDASILAFYTKNPAGYGRVFEKDGEFFNIIEEKDANEEEKKNNLVNSGIYLFKNSLLTQYLKEISNNNAQGEYYLTDLPAILKHKNYSVVVYKTEKEENFYGVNDRKQLADADRIAIHRNIEKHLANGVTIYQPETVRIEDNVEIGNDTIIYPGVIVEQGSKIGKNCVLKSGCVIIESLIGNNTTILEYSHLEGAKISSNCSIGPFARLRPGTEIETNVKVGNFVETKKAILKNGVKASHLSYLGDCEIGENTNIGAGTITCNYDGEKKHKTIIGKNCFIGSDTQLVAPVKIGDFSYIGAGSTITNNVPECSLALSRAKQKVIEGWPKKKGKKCHN